MSEVEQNEKKQDKKNECDLGNMCDVSFCQFIHTNLTSLGWVVLKRLNCGNSTALNLK